MRHGFAHRRRTRVARRICMAMLSVTATTLPLTGRADAKQTGSDATISTHFVEFTLPTPGPLGSVAFIGDSVGIGAGRWSPTLPDQLARLGWGPIRFHAVDGKRTGYPPGWPAHFNAVPMIDEWQATGWDADTWIINLGANDSGYCSRDVACARAAIMLVVDAIGPGHRIWWPQVTRLYTHQYQADAWNLALAQIAAERDDFWTWDWPAEMRADPVTYDSYDGTHLYPDGYRTRSRVMAEQFTDAVARSVRVGPDASLASVAGPPAALRTVTPVRLADTRVEAPGRLRAGDVLVVDVAGDMSAAATGVFVNVAAVDPGDHGYLSVYDCGHRPPTSTVNYAAGQSRAAGAIVSFRAARQLCVFSLAATDVIVDLQAELVTPAASGALRLRPLPAPTRLADTRSTGRTAMLTIALPAGLVAPGADAAAAINLTATGAAAPGYLAAHPCGGPVPFVSNVNFYAGETIAAAGVAKVGADGTLCVTASASVDVVVDVTGVFVSGGELVYTPVTSTRAMDTRAGLGGWSPIHANSRVLDVGVAPPNVAAVTGTLTIVHPLGPSYLRAAPCADANATTSSVNGVPGAAVANLTTVAVSNGRLCITSWRATHTLFDVTGWWAPG